MTESSSQCGSSKAKRDGGGPESKCPFKGKPPEAQPPSTRPHLLKAPFPHCLGLETRLSPHRPLGNICHVNCSRYFF